MMQLGKNWNYPNFEIPDWVWTPAGSEEDPHSRLLTTIIVNKCYMHLEAYALVPDTDLQTFSDLPYFQDEQDAFYSFATGATDTVTISGREYVLIAHPHGA